MTAKKQLQYEIDSNNCWIVTSHKITKCGYAVMWENGKKDYTHRIMHTRYNGEIPKGLVVRHTCDVPACINPEHLICGTHAENMNDMALRNRSNQGEKSPFVKLKEVDVLFILNSKKSIPVLAKQFGVIPKTIRNIRNRKTWKHLDKRT